MKQNATAAAIDTDPLAEEERLRAEMYLLLARLLASAPGRDFLAQLTDLQGDGSELGRGIAALARVAGSASPDSVAREYDALFIGLGRGELLPYGSYYLTGFLNEKPLARLRDHMAQIGIRRDADVKEPEDHIATLCEMMAGLITGAFAQRLTLDDQEAFFNSHIAPWAGHFFTDLEGAEGSLFYAPVGKIGRTFMEIEIEAFRLDG